MTRKSARRKHLVRSPLRRSSTSSHAPASPPPVALDLGPLAVACANLALGYSVTAKHARDVYVADHATMLADAYRSLAAHVVGLALSLGHTPPRTKSTCGERLRWEWLASSARLLDGAPEERLLAECARTQLAADRAAAAVHTDAAVKLHPAMRQIHATLVRARNASARLAGHPAGARAALAPT